jgi:ABC-type Zn uptake system ZnuABC Zn-binding protein ZnuA
MSRSFQRAATAIGIACFPLLLISLALPGCSSKDDDVWPKDKTGPKVVVSFAPYYCFAANVAGDDAIIKTMMTTSGPHHFNATDKDAHLLRRADLFLVNGLGLDEVIAENLKKGTGNSQLKIVELGEKIPEDKLVAGVCHHQHKDGDHDHDKDSHVWLSPDYAIILVEGIRDELKAADPSHAANYDRRCKEYVEKLHKLKADGLAMLKDKKDRRMITFHESLAYFAKTFDLDVVSVVEKTPGSEPNDQQLKALIALCADSDKPIRIVTVEPQYSTSNSGSQLIESLKHKKVPDPALVEFDTLETVVPNQLTPDWYETKMRANLNALAEKMK